MRRLTILTHFRGAAAEPSGEPPQTDPRARSVAIEVVDDDGELQITTLTDGALGPAAQPGVLHGAAVYRITAGTGRFDGASGLITSNFVLDPATGEFEERQVAVVFVA
jgi:hypothetical protein